jgi:hypothetical protein
MRWNPDLKDARMSSYFDIKDHSIFIFFSFHLCRLAPFQHLGKGSCDESRNLKSKVHTSELSGFETLT